MSYVPICIEIILRGVVGRKQDMKRRNGTLGSKKMSERITLLFILAIRYRYILGVCIYVDRLDR